MRVVANTLVTTRYLKGLVPETSIASICSVTFIEPNSAPILLPILPANISAVITGPNSLLSDMYDFRQYAVWLIAMVLVAFGFHYAKGIIAFVLDKMYQFFIENNPAGV